MVFLRKLEVTVFSLFLFQRLKNALLLGVLIFVGAKSFADQIVLSQDELAQETVYPLFDNPISVKSRNIKDSETFDVGIIGGYAISEPISNPSKYGATINYHFSELHSLGLIWTKNSTGVSKDAEALQTDFSLDFTRAPNPEYSLLTDYNYKLFYGKLSITKESVLNTSIYTSVSAGLLKYVHKSYPAIAVGVGERFYFNHHLSLKADLRIFINNAPIPFKSGALRTGVDPVPAYDSFDERITYTTHLELGLNYLF